MMDFRTPERDRYRNFSPPRPQPLATVPPPRPQQTQVAESQEPAVPGRRLNRKSSSGNLRKASKIISALAIAGLIAWLVHGYVTTRNQLELAKSTPAAGASTQTGELIGKVAQLVELPGGETPTIATVNDASKLKSQQFFAGAKNGDKVLIFSKAGKAVLYRPSTNKIIEYSTVNLSGASTQ